MDQKKDYNVLDGNMVKGLFGWMVGDKGYICSRVSQKLAKKGLKLLTKTKSNRKKYPATKFQNYLFSKREKIETVFSLLKFQLNMVATGAKSLLGFFSHLSASILLYCICKVQNIKKDFCIDTFEQSLIS